MAAELKRSHLHRNAETITLKARPTKSPTFCGRLPHFGAISRSPAVPLKSPAFLLDQRQVVIETRALHFGQLIMRKIVKIVVTRCHMLRLT